MFGLVQLSKMELRSLGRRTGKLSLYEAHWSWRPLEKGPWITSTDLLKGSNPQ